MKIIEISPQQYNEISFAEPNTSFYQTSYWANYNTNLGYKPLYIGYIDKNNMYSAMAMILVKKPSLLSKKIAFCPFGFLINYYDKQLLTSFTKDLNKYLSRKGIKTLTINPYVPYNTNKGNNDLLINDLKQLGYIKKQENFIYNIPISEKIKLSEDICVDTYEIKDATDTLLNSNDEYKQLYNAFGNNIKFIVCKLDSEHSINKLKATINDGKASSKQIENVEINNKKISNNKIKIENAQNKLALLEDYINNPNTNSILGITCLINYANRVTRLFTKISDDCYFVDTEKYLNKATYKYVAKLGFDSFYSVAQTNNCQKIDLIGEFTCTIK